MMSDFGKSGARQGMARMKVTNVGPQGQSMDIGFRDVMRHKHEQVARPPAVVHNHLHGSDMLIRNQLNNIAEDTSMPPKFQRTLTPSPGSNDSDYYSINSSRSAITPPPFARSNTSEYFHHTELPHGMEHPLTSPGSVLPRSAGSYHGKSSSFHHFSAPKPANEASRKPRIRRRHSSVETSANGPTEVLKQDHVHHVTNVPSRPQSSASHTHEQMVSNRLNRHKSYYEAVNNAAVTSQTVFSHRSERIKTLPEEVPSTTDNEASVVSPSSTVCANGIKLEMTKEDTLHVHQKSPWREKDHYHDYAQSDSELVTSSPKTYPRRRGNGVLATPQPLDAAHPRLRNSTNPPSPLIVQHSSPTLHHHQFNPPVQHGSPQQQSRHRKFSYDSSYVQQVNGRAFTRSGNSSSLSDRRVKHKPPPIAIPDLIPDECVSDGEIALRRGNTVQVDRGNKKFSRKRNKSFTNVSSPSQGKSSSRPKSISSHVLHKIAKNFRRGGPENAKVLHVFDEKDRNTQAVSSPPYTGQVESMPIIDSESNEPLVHRMRSNSVGNSSAYQDYQRTQSMELLSEKQQAAINGKETHSVDDLHHEGSPLLTPTKYGSKGWVPKRKKSTSLDTDVFVDTTNRSSSKRSLTDTYEALFKAVINNNRAQVEQILASTQVDLTWHNADDFTVLDVAVLLNHTHVAHILMAYGARESPKFVRNPELRYNHLLQLLSAAEEQINKCRTNLSQFSLSASLDETTKLKEHWSTKKTMLQHMLSVYNTTKPPDPPTNVQLDITSSHSLSVRFSEPKKDNGSPVTRYRVEWSKCFDFAVVDGSFVLSDLSYKLDTHSHSLEYNIPDLASGEKYFVRVSASNIKRFGSASYSVPSGATPCSWHDVGGTEPRYAGSTSTIQTIAMQLRQVINEEAANKDAAAACSNTSGKSKMKRGLSKIFGGALKFHKNLKGGLYFALLMYSNDEKVLVTVDDYLPIVEVSESFNSQTIKQDFLWLSKLACTWENVKNMCDSSESYTVSSTIQFRNKLLHAIIDLQASLGTNDLGLVHPLPYQNNDNLVIVLVKNMKDPREIQNSSLRWIPQGKLWKKHSSSTSDETPSIPDQLITEAHFIMDHNSASVKPVARGLYLGYLKTRSSLAGVKVVVSKQFPNLLPHTKIRDNPHISKDEWLWLTYLHQPKKDEAPPYVAMEACCELQKLLTMKVVELLTSRGITKKEEIEQHRLYINEVVELNENVSFLLLLPPPDQVCTSLGETDRFEHVSYMGMPFTSFEIAQLYTYQKVFITLYTQVSSTLDMELLIAQHRLREAFSKDEISQGKELQEKLEKFLQETERVWKNMHWLDSAVQIGRKTDHIHGISLRSLRKNPMTIQSPSPSPNLDSSSDQGKLSHRDHAASHSKPLQHTQLKNRYSSSRIEELKVTPLYNTGLAKGSTVKLHVLQITKVKEVIQLAVKALEDARSKKQPDKPAPAISSNPNDFYLLSTRDGGYNERILDDEFPILELHKESPDFKLFLKKKSDLDSSDCYTTSV